MTTKLIFENKAVVTDIPVIFQNHWQTVTRDSITYDLIHTFDKYVTQELINQALQVFETEEEYQLWLNSTDIVPTITIEKNISNHPLDNTIMRKAVCLEFPTINFKKNELKIRLGIYHYINDTEQKQLYRDIELVANNTQQIEGTGDYDYFINKHINEGLTIPQLVISAILLRDSDNTINTKCNY